MDIQNLGKGGLIQKNQLRNYRLETVPGAIVLPPNFEIIFGGKIKHQDGSSSCVSQATSYYAEVLNFKETGQWVELSSKFLYSQCFQQSGGSYTKDNMALMCNEGIATEILTPSYEQNLPPSEIFMERKQDITPTASEDALTYITKNYLTWDNTNIDLYKQAIMQGSGCVVISWGNNYCWQNAQILVPDNQSQMVWMHGIYLVGWDDATRNFKFINSWGTEWGQQGYGYLPYDYVTNGYLGNPMTMVDLPNCTYSLIMKIIGLYHNLISLLTGK